jgi:hypothetical protein
LINYHEEKGKSQEGDNPAKPSRSLSKIDSPKPSGYNLERLMKKKGFEMK